MRCGFLFGAGAEIGYGLPPGGKFALDIFRHDASQSKQDFKEMRNSVDMTTSYASYWLPNNFKEKNISSFGRSVYQNIINDTISNNRLRIIENINNFDEIATKEVHRLKQERSLEVVPIIEGLLDRKLSNIHLGQSISFIQELQDGNELFNNSYFSALLLLYKNRKLLDDSARPELGKIILSIIQLQIGALGETLSHKINDSLFAKKDDEIDIFDDLGEIIQLNYAASGLSGMEYLLEPKSVDTSTDSRAITLFARNIMEAIYASVLDYKSLIDSNWHYLYSPSSDWAKFCKICIFLLNVRDYISGLATETDFSKKHGYYHMLKDAIDQQKLEISVVATTNYNHFIADILAKDIVFLNGSTEFWYDPYLNRIGAKEDLRSAEGHIVVPLLFTQSGTKPITSIGMSIQYVDTYRSWKESDCIAVVGFGFGPDDEHINGILRTLIDVDGKKLVVVTKRGTVDDVAKKLKIVNKDNIIIIQVDDNGVALNNQKTWVDSLIALQI